MKLKTPESGVLNACLGLLAAERIWHMRMNTTGTRVMRYQKKNGESRTGVIRGLTPGTADILATPSCVMLNGNPEVAWIECKSDSGKQSPEQIEFEKEVRKAGHLYVVVRSSDELKNWLTQRGMMRPK